MALYVSKAARQRKLVLAVLVGAVLAFVVGLLIGRSMTSSVSDQVSSVRRSADHVATAVERLDIEYAQVLEGTDDLHQSVLKPIDELRQELQSTMERAPWLASAQRSTMLDAIAKVRSSAEGRASADEFDATLTEAAATVRQSFGVTPG